MDTIVGLMILGAVVWVGFVLARKAGYRTRTALWMAVGMLVPVVNVGILVYFVLATWPIQSELASLRGRAGVASEDDARALCSEALRLETQGYVHAAMAKHEEVIRAFPDSERARDASASIRSLRARTGQS